MKFWQTLPDDLQTITDRAKSNLAWFSYFAGAFSMLYAAVNFFHEKHLPGSIQMLVCGFIFFVIPWFIRRGVNIRFLTYVYLVAGCVCVYYNTYIRGGIYDPVISWSIFIPLIPLLILGVRDALIWLGITCIIVIIFFILHAAGFRDEQASKETLNPFFNLTVLLGIIILVFMISQTFNDSKNEALIALNEKNKELDATQQDLLLAQKYKDLFVANVSHELRTPMNIIIGLSDMLKERSIDPGDQKLLEGIHTSAKDLLVLINDILDISKIRSGQLSVSFANFDPAVLLERVFKLYESKREHKGLVGRLELQDNVPGYLVSDPMRINQVVSNLMDNAIKYSDQGCITLSSHLEGDHAWVIRVTDEGRGISKEKQPFIFDPFFRVDPHEKMEGLGLGLAITKQVVEALGGSIELESEPGIGTTVTVSLPVEIATAASQQETLVTDSMREAMRGIRVLVGEDNMLNRVITGDILVRNIPDCSVEFAVDGREVLNKLSASAYNIILMDIRMPVMDGIQTTREIRKIYGQGPLIIALTANAMNDEMKECITAGMNEHIAKPIVAEELVLKMFRLLHPAS